MEGIEIDWKIFIGQLINFSILFFVLKTFIYKPFLETVKKRREKIEEGVNKSFEAEEKLQKLSEIKKKMEAENETQKREIIFAAEEEAKKRVSLAMEKSEQERATVLAKAEKEAEALKEREKEKIKKQIVENTFSLTEKLLKENIDDSKNKKITEEFLNKI
jgi:F-type H+-transporting ATPase subunit b